jgi:hypothetical protein
MEKKNPVTFSGEPAFFVSGKQPQVRHFGDTILRQENHVRVIFKLVF